MSARSLLLFTLAIGVLASPSTARADANPNFTIPLHAMEGTATSCQDYLPVDCVMHRPNVNIAPGGITTVFVFVANHNELNGLQTAFEWELDWNHLASVFECRPYQLNMTTPENPGGPLAGQIMTAFNCVTNPALAIIGYMVFDVGTQGCLRQINPVGPPVRVATLDCDLLLDLLDADDPAQQLRLGKICINAGGRDACEPLATPIESGTWGKIKANYRR